MSFDYDTDDSFYEEFQKMTTRTIKKHVVDVKSAGDDCLVYFFEDNSISLVDHFGKTLAAKRFADKISSIAACPDHFCVFFGDSFKCFKIEEHRHLADRKIMVQISSKTLTNVTSPVEYADVQDTSSGLMVVWSVNGSSVGLYKLKARTTEYLHFGDHGVVCALSLCQNARFLACAFDIGLIKVFSVKGGGLFGVFGCDVVGMVTTNKLLFSRNFEVLSYVSQGKIYLYELSNLYFQEDRNEVVGDRAVINLGKFPDARVLEVDYKGENYQEARRGRVVEVLVNWDAQKVRLTRYEVSEGDEWHQKLICNADIDHELEDLSDDEEVIKTEIEEEEAWIRADGTRCEFADLEGIIPSDKDFHYLGCYPKRGVFVIFNFKYLDSNQDLQPTVPSSEDEDETILKKMARKLGFEEDCIFVHRTVRKRRLPRLQQPYSQVDEAREKIKEIVHKKKSYLSQSDCFMCVFISKEKFTVSRNLTRAVEPSNCPALAGKPKLFFIQAPRGEKKDVGFDSYHAIRDDEPSTSGHGNQSGEPEEGNHGNGEVPCVRHLLHYDNPMPRQIPSQADLLIAHSTCKDYESCTKTYGEASPYLKYLTDVINRYHMTQDLLSMMTHVNYLMSNKYTNEDETKQMPSFVSQLTRKVRFLPKY